MLLFPCYKESWEAVIDCVSSLAKNSYYLAPYHLLTPDLDPFYLSSHLCSTLRSIPSLSSLLIISLTFSNSKCKGSFPVSHMCVSASSSVFSIQLWFVALCMVLFIFPVLEYKLHNSKKYNSSVHFLSLAVYIDNKHMWNECLLQHQF